MRLPSCYKYRYYSCDIDISAKHRDRGVIAKGIKIVGRLVNPYIVATFLKYKS